MFSVGLVCAIGTFIVADDDGGETTSAVSTTHIADIAEPEQNRADDIPTLPPTAFYGSKTKRKTSFANHVFRSGRMIVTEEWDRFIRTFQSTVREKADGLVDGKSCDDWVKD